MLDLKQQHLDDFTLLRHATSDLAEVERAVAELHLGECLDCRSTFTEIQQLDKELTLLAEDAGVRPDWHAGELPEEDPFRRRPPEPQRPASTPPTIERLARACAASENAVSASDVMLKAVKDARRALTEILSTVSPSRLADRFALLYALQEAGQEIAEDPPRLLTFAEEVIAVLGDSGWRQSGPHPSEEERVVPCLLLRAQAHQLAGQACLWTGEFEEAGGHFRSAYRAFGLTGDETGAARVEQLEAQRRFFIGQGREALVLARRAGTTFAVLGLEDEQARCHAAEGMALFQMDRWQEAVDAFRDALPVFETYQLWSNYVGALNCIATALVKLRCLEEARREYARALRRLSRERHRSFLPFIRRGLAEVLFSAGRFREAAIQSSRAARLYADSGQISRSLMASLLEAESWARAGDLGRAMHRLELFRAELAHHGALDPALARLIEQALSGSSPDFQEIATLRERAESSLTHRFGTPG